MLVSSSTKVCLDQMPIPAQTNERGAFDAFWDDLLAAYGRSDLFEAVSLDAGYAAEALCRRIDADGYGYIVAIKDNQPGLFDEARAHFLERIEPLDGRSPEAPESQTDWERYRGRRIKRQLWRTTELAGINGWDHLRQIWLVRQLTEHPDGRVEVRDRLRASNLVPGRLNGVQILATVRAHWAPWDNRELCPLDPMEQPGAVGRGPALVGLPRPRPFGAGPAAPDGPQRPAGPFWPSPQGHTPSPNALGAAIRLRGPGASAAFGALWT